jgi:phage terminase small subunit
MKRLTARQHKIRLFAIEYCVDFNATRAAEASGYSAKRARQTGHELMDDPEVQVEIEKVMKKREERSRVKAFKVLEELAIVAFSNEDDYRFDPNTGKLVLREGAHPDALRAVQAVNVKKQTFKLYSKTEALRMAGQHLGLYKEIIETRDLTLEDLLLEDDDDSDAAKK